MLRIDLHVHTIKSACGLHTVLEMVGQAASLGMHTIAITDHDVDPGIGHHPGHGIRVLSYRFPKLLQGVRVLAGIELSILDGGEVRLPRAVKLADLSICLAGLHSTLRSIQDDPRRCTDDLEAALAKYPYIDVLTHPTIRGFDLEHQRAAQLLARHGVATEINNSALWYGKEDPDQLLDFLACCKQEGVWLATNSDAHVITELGQDDHIQRILARAHYPEDRIINRDPDRLEAFLAGRRKHKQNG